MNNIDQIQSSYNLRIQNQIFSEEDKITEAREAYFVRRNGVRLEYNEKIKAEQLKITELKVNKKYLKEETQREYKLLKEKLQNEVRRINQEYKFSCLEIKDNAKLHLQKIESIFRQNINQLIAKIDVKSVDLNVSEELVIADSQYQLDLNKLNRKYEKNIYQVTKRYYYEEKKKNYRFRILNTKNNSELKEEYSKFKRNFKLKEKSGELFDLKELQKELILSNNYKYHLTSLLHELDRKKQELINQSYARIVKLDASIENVITQRLHEHEIGANINRLQLEKMMTNYKQFYEEEKLVTNQARNEELAVALNQKNANISRVKKAYETRISELNEKYYQTTKVNKLKVELKKERDSTQIQQLKEEIKNANFIYREKKLINAKISEIKKVVQAIKLEKKEKVRLNQENLLEAKLHKNQVISECKNNIKTLKLERKEHYNSLTKEEKEEYRVYEKYAKEERIERVKMRFDNVEKKVFKHINTAYIYAVPAIFSAIIFTVFPFFFMIIGSLFKLDLANPKNTQFLGFTNYYNNFVVDSEFQMSLYNTILYSIFTVILLSIVTIGMAAWLAKDTKIHNAAQTMIFTPHIASFVAISILWMAMLKPEGIINQILAIFGIKGPGWLVQPNTALLSVSFVTVWKDVGYYILIIISGLQSIPRYVYEAAKLDKSTKANTFFHLTLPLLTPTLSFVFMTKFINSFKIFAPIEIMTGGGPMGSSMVLSYWVYKVGRIGFNYGKAMAGAVILTLFIATFTFLNNRFFRRTIKY
ncbi:MAG: ABC transporter permease subunit [Acholeplasmataceae bacterium]